MINNKQNFILRLQVLEHKCCIHISLKQKYRGKNLGLFVTELTSLSYHRTGWNNCIYW